jgi:hypothetical protein
LFGRLGNSAGALSDSLDGIADLIDGANGVTSRCLNLVDLRGNFFCGFCGLIGKRFDFGGNNGEPFAGFAGARGLNRRVERQQIGLAGDLVDQTDDFANFLRSLI